MYAARLARRAPPSWAPRRSPALLVRLVASDISSCQDRKTEGSLLRANKKSQEPRRGGNDGHSICLRQLLRGLQGICVSRERDNARPRQAWQDLSSEEKSLANFHRESRKKRNQGRRRSSPRRSRQPCVLARAPFPCIRRQTRKGLLLLLLLLLAIAVVTIAFSPATAPALRCPTPSARASRACTTTRRAATGEEVGVFPRTRWASCSLQCNHAPGLRLSPPSSSETALPRRINFDLRFYVPILKLNCAPSIPLHYILGFLLARPAPSMSQARRSRRRSSTPAPSGLSGRALADVSWSSR